MLSAASKGARSASAVVVGSVEDKELHVEASESYLAVRDDDGQEGGVLVSLKRMQSE